MNNLIKSYKLLFFIQNNFDKKVSDKLFGKSSDHLFIKWLNTEYNMLNFISMLDNENRNLLLLWGDFNINKN